MVSLPIAFPSMGVGRGEEWKENKTWETPGLQENGPWLATATVTDGSDGKGRKQ